MIEEIKKTLKKIAKEDINAGLQFENCSITIDEKEIQLEGNLNLNVVEK